MVNGNVDRNSTSSNLKPDEECVKHRTRTEAQFVSSPSTDSKASSSRNSSSSAASCENNLEKAGVGGEEVASRDMAEAPTKTSLFCSVPLNKFRSVLSSAGCKNDDEENFPKINQISRKLLCLYCDRTFVSSNLRQKHVERCHSEKQSRRLSSRKLQSQFTTTACFHCDKLPVEHSLRQLFEHLISAHSLKYFGCLLCEERFLNQIQLNDHNTKLHNLSQRDQPKANLGRVNRGSEKSNEANKTFTDNTEEKKHKEQKNTLNVVKKKRTTKSKPPPRQLRSKKKVAIKASKVGSKRSKRLQSAQNKVPARKKKTKTESPKSEENTSKTTEKVKTSPVNPYPEFDYYYRVKKITDHSIDNLKISSLTFDDVFDKAFFNRIKCNIQENLLYHLDGKLFKNEESETRISNFEKNPPTQEVSSTASENFGCDLSLNAVTPVTSILASNFGEDLESQIEYGSKPSKKKLQIRQDPVRHKYVTRRKYQASILEHKENRDLSKLDMWTQLVIKDRQQKVLNGQKSAKEILEYTTCAEYKLKIQRTELNRILDRRGPFEDLKEEASKKAALEQLNSEYNNEISEECFKDVRSLMEDLLMGVVKNCSRDKVESVDNVELSERPEFLEKEDIPELPDYLKLRRTSLVPSEEEIDKSDKIALICSSQETENYELPTNTVRDKDEMIELSGEWARSRIYVCAACGLKVPNMKLLIDHKSLYHQNSWVQHYELVGNQSELYRHLCIPGLGKVGYVEETVPCKTWSKSESRVCTKCGKVCNSLSELHRHILECGGDWTWMLARKKCKYRPFGARKKRRGLVKRIRVSNQKTDQTEKKKYKKTFEGPRQRPSDADTIQRMLANLPPKRSSRKSICMKDGFPRNRQKSPKNKKQVMKCGKIVRHKSTYEGNEETTKNSSNRKNSSVRQTLRSISRTLSSKILDTNSKLKAKRQLIQKINRRSPRKNSQNVSEATDKSMKNEESSQINIQKTINNSKNKKEGNSDKVKTVLKGKVNMKTFFPVSKRKTSKNTMKMSEIVNSDSSQPSQNVEENFNEMKNKPTKNVINFIKNSLNLNKKVNSKNDAIRSGNSEPIVVIEKLPQIEQPGKKPSTKPTTKKAPNKRKLRSSFRKVIDKVKKLKLDNTTSLVPSEKNKELSIKLVNSFLGQGAREKEKLATVLVPLVEESKESPPSNLAFVQNAMDNNSPTEESLIPENIFNLQHNSEDLLQAKSPLEIVTNEVKKNEKRKYFSALSAKIIDITESFKGGNEVTAEIETKSDMTKPAKNSNNAITLESVEASEVNKTSLLSIETTAKLDKSPLVSPILSPSMLSPRMKGKIRKPNRGLNDCIAMLTKKAVEETHKIEVFPDPVDSTGKPCMDNRNEAHKIIRANECILKIPLVEGNSQIQSEVLDLSKPKKNLETYNPPQKNTVDSSTSKPSLWNPVNDISCSSQTSIDDSKVIRSTSSTKMQNIVVNPSIEKAILKIPKFVEVSRSNNVDIIIQGVIENYDEPITNQETIKSFSNVPSHDLLNSVDRTIEEVVKSNSESSLKEETITTKKTESSVGKKCVPIENNFPAVHTTPKSKKLKKSKEDNNSSKEDQTIKNFLSSEGSGLNISTHEKLEILDAPRMIPTPSTDSMASELFQSSINIENPSAPSEGTLPEKFLNDTKYTTNVTPDENINPVSSDIVDTVPVSHSYKKNTGKKIGEIRKRTSKKPSRKSDTIKAENPYVEKIDLKVTTHNILSTVLQTNEPDILEEKQILANDGKIVSTCVDVPVTQPTNKSCEDISSIPESSKLHKTDDKLISDLEETSKNKISLEDNEYIEKNILEDICTSSTQSEDKNESDFIVCETNEENDFKTSSTDSEDDLPLLILKSRHKILKKIPEALEENNEKIKSELSKCQEEIIEKNKKDNLEVEEIIENASQLNKLITGEFPFPTENEKLPDSDTSSNKEDTEILPQNVEDRRKSPRKSSTSSDTQPDKNGKKSNKRNKSKNLAKLKRLEETIEREKILENISNIIEPKKHLEECCQDTSDNEVRKNASMETNSSPNHLDAVVIDSYKKPKNFLVDTTVSDFKSHIKNSHIFSSKSSKTKKKNKVKHDSVKTKLIFKFPKIILKEPVLRIPPRDNVTEITTSFGNIPDNTQDKGIKLILDNPFLNIKEREEKLSPITNISDILGKSIESETSAKIKSSNKKRSNKHKKKSLRFLGKEENKNKVTSDPIEEASFENVKTSPSSNLSNNEGNFSVQDNFETLPSPRSEKIPHDIFGPTEKTNKTDKSIEMTLNQPISFKLQTNSTKRSGSRKKRDKAKRSSLFNQLDDKSTENDCSNLEETTISINENVDHEPEKIEETSTTQNVELIENCNEVFLKDEWVKGCEIEIGKNGLADLSKVGSEISHQTFVSEFQLNQKKKPEDQHPSSLKLSGMNLIDNITVDNKECIPSRPGRSLRSTVKITYKQSNIFALQIEDQEISDLKITENPKNLPENVSLLKDENTTNHHKEDSITKELANHGSFKEDIKIVSSKKWSNSKKTKTDCQPVLLKNKDLEETINSESIINTNQSNKHDVNLSSEDRSKFNLLEMKERERENEMPEATSKRNRRSSKTKEISNEVVEVNSIVGSVPPDMMGISDEEKANELVEKRIIVNNILEKIIDDSNTTDSLNENKLLEKNMTKEVFALNSDIIVEPIEDVLSSGKYEDSSFSEGELVINESFENQESTIFDEPTKCGEKFEIDVTKIDNLLKQNESISVDSKSQISKRHKKVRSSKTEKKSNEDHNMKTIESSNLNEICSFVTNDIYVDDKMTEKRELTSDMNKSENSGLKAIDMMENTCEDPQKPPHEKKDEFEFEEDISSTYDVSSNFRKKKIEAKDSVMESISLHEEKLENIFVPSDAISQRFSLDPHTTRRQRSAKSKALENINIIEKKLDQVLNIELSPKPENHDEHLDVPLKGKKKLVKHQKESAREFNNPENAIKKSIEDTLIQKDKKHKMGDGTSHRKNRAAKAKAIENIKILETKVDDIEEIDRTNENLYGNEKFKKNCKSKARQFSQVKGNNKQSLSNHIDQTHSTKEKATEEECRDEANNITLFSSGLSSTFIETSSFVIEELDKSIDEKNINKRNNLYGNSDIQHELNDKFNGKEKNTKINLILQKSQMKKLEEKDSVFKTNKKEDIISLAKRNKLTKSVASKNISEEKISEKTSNFENNCGMRDITKSTYEIENYNRMNLFSFEAPSDMYQKRKRNDNLLGDSEVSKNNKEDCYDIANIDEDDNLGSEESILLSPSKKKKKPIGNEKKMPINDLEGNCLKIHTDETPSTKIGYSKEKAMEHNYNVSLGTDVNETEQVDSLDITLKTTVDEISSILMENKDIHKTDSSAKTNFESSFHPIIPNESRKNPIGEKYWIEQHISSDISDKCSDKKRNRDSSFAGSMIRKEKTWNMEMGAAFETENKRRNRRACKVNTYNENDLAEAIFQQAASEKEKAKKKKTEGNMPDSSNSKIIKKVNSNEVLTEKKLNSDELFDLLKATAPDNLIALKPVEQNPSDTPITDDNFDDEFDDILRKSQALFGKEPYKKLDDICRSDDSSSTSKLTGFYRSDENTESNDLIKKSTESYFGENTFNNSMISAVKKNQINKSEEISSFQSDDLYCDLCKKSFKRNLSLIKHKTTLTHIAKLSEMEAQEAQNKLRVEIQSNEDSFNTNIPMNDPKQQTNSSFSYPTNTGHNALKIAEIITEALEKPTSHGERGFTEMITPLPEYRRYKSLGERKSFEYEQGSPNITENADANSYKPKISNNTGVILEKQINLLQNIVGMDCTNDASTSSYQSLVNSIGRDSPVSIVSSKLEDSTNLVFPNDLDGEMKMRSGVEDFLKPPQIEDISEDSVNLKNSEDVKSRKVLNRDEELFLECCSLLKSGSEVSNFSKKSNRNSFFNNVSMKMSEEPDVLESKNVIFRVAEESSDYSRRATPLGDSFGDTSNSNTISSSWGMNKNEQLNKNQENFFNFGERENKSGNDEGAFNSSKFKNLASTDAAKCLPKKNIKSNSEFEMSRKRVNIPNKPSPKLPTKGALKIFDGLKVSLPTSELNMEILRKKLLAKKLKKNSSEKPPSEKQFLCPKTPRRKSKPVKNKPPIDDRFIFKVNKKPPLKDTEETKSKSSEETVTDKINDVYDFEETQDNTDVFAKPDFKSFRAKGTEIDNSENTDDNNYEAQTMSSSSSSTLSGKKAKPNECITKKKHMIMGRIFKNAVKPKLDEEIRDIPAIDHNELVENYVESCTPKSEEKELKKPKMTEEEMNYLFDKLLDEPIEPLKKSCSSNKTDNKNTGLKKKLKMKCKKRQRSNSESTDDEFVLNRIVKKRPGRKNAKEEDNSINLEQELKECIGVASRKSQRKCTSGKQNVLVEYWSSDESAFETFLENHLQELSEKSDLSITHDEVDKQEDNDKIPSIPRENRPKNLPCRKNKQPKPKSKISPKKKEVKELSTSTNEILETSAQSNRRKRTAAHPLYHWSSSSEDEMQDFIEVKSIRDDPEDEYDEERPVQHGWIVGDSPKKLVTMLAQAKGKKTEPESLVKEQGKKKNSNS